MSNQSIREEAIVRALAALDRMGGAEPIHRGWLDGIPTERLGTVIADLERHAEQHPDLVPTVTMTTPVMVEVERVDQQVVYLPLEGWVPREPGSYLPMDENDKPMPKRAAVQPEELGY